MYTDASKMGDRVAIGNFVPRSNCRLSLRVTDNVSIFTAELTAIKKGIEWMARPDGPARLALFTDSYSSLLALKNSANANKSPLVASTLELIHKIMHEGKEVTVIWVPSHVGIDGNEAADRLAKSAIKHPEVELDIPRELTDFKRAIKKEIMKEWQTRWDEESRGRHYWSIESKVSRKIKFATTPRCKEVAITRLRLGKCQLNHYLKILDLHNTGLCETCRSPETVEHWVLNCKANGKPRARMKRICRRFKQEFTLPVVLGSKMCQDILFSWIKEKEITL